MALTTVAAEVFRDFALDGVPPSGPHEPKKPDIRRLLSGYEQVMNAFTSSGGIVAQTLAGLSASLNYPSLTMAWVLNDPVAANNGIYQKQGASGSGSWLWTKDLPYSFIVASDEGAGTANEIEAASALPISGSALVLLNIFETNGPGPVTVRFNGAGPVYTIKTASGNDPATGGLLAGMQVMGRVSGETFRLYSDQASAAVLAAAEAAVLEAQGHAEDAQAAAAISTGAMSTLLDPLFATRAVAMAWTPVSAPDYIRTAGYAAAGDGGGALYKKVGSQPAHAGKFSITLSDAVTIVWFEIAEQVLTERMFGAPCDGNWAYGGTDALTQLQAWASCPVSNRKRFTGVSKSSDTINFPIDTILEGSGFATGIDLGGASGMTGAAGIVFDGSANLVQISDLSANVAKSATSFNIVTGTDVVAGDYICIYNPTDWSWVSAVSAAGGRNTYRAGEWCRVQSVATNTLTVFEPLWAGYTAAAVDVYRLRGNGPKLRSFRIKPPYLEVAAIKIDCAINPVLEDLRTDGSEYAGILLQRCIEPHTNCNLFQMVDAGTPGNEYGVIHSSCFGGEVHGCYYAERHGVAFGNADFVACVAARNTRVYADTYSPHGAGSLDFGHGCTENLQAIGGTHRGISLGGKGHSFVGVKVRKGTVTAGNQALLVSGSEFVGGDFRFIGCEFEGLAVASGSALAHIALTIQAAITEEVRFIFDGCIFKANASTARFIEIVASAAGFDTSLIANDPVVRGAGLTAFARLNYTTGNGYGVVDVRGVKGMGGSVARVTTNGSPPVAQWLLDSQAGVVTVNGVTTQPTSAVTATFGWPYPVGAVPFVQAWMNGGSIGGDRCIAIAGSITNANFTATAITTDGGNFASTAAGAVGWKADFY